MRDNNFIDGALAVLLGVILPIALYSHCCTLYGVRGSSMAELATVMGVQLLTLGVTQRKRNGRNNH